MNSEAKSVGRGNRESITSAQCLKGCMQRGLFHNIDPPAKRIFAVIHKQPQTAPVEAIQIHIASMI